MVNSNLTTEGVSSPTNLVFVDTAVPNFSSLLAGLSPNTEAIVLDPTQDGISQITNFLGQRSGLVDSIQILSHGAAGMLQLGSTSISTANLDKYQSALSTWFPPQANQNADKKPDLLIYGCDVASGEVGTNFIQKLSQMTGADVAASVDLTGSAAKGGNWILEKATGVIEAGQAFSQQVRDAYQDVLQTFTVTNNNDSGPNSLRQAIIDANAATDADNIVFNIGSGGVQTIKLLTPLPIITTPINLDGRTQPGSGGKPAIELRGDSIPDLSDYYKSLSNGLTFWGIGSSNSTARGFIINRFAGNGVKIGEAYEAVGSSSNPNPAERYIQGPSGVTIDNNYIGTDITGTVGLPNSWFGDPNTVNAVYAHKSPGTKITNNLISGNATTAIIIRTESTDVQIINNKIGTDITGTLPLGNQRAALYLSNFSHNLLFQNNLVAANGYDNLTGGIQAVWYYNSDNFVIKNSTFGQSIDGKPLRNRGYIDSSMNSGANPDPETISLLAGNPATLVGTTINATPFASPATLPVLNSKNPNLTDVINDPAAINQGDLVKDLVGGSILGNGINASSDYGIAITAVAANPNGAWQYSFDNGKEWFDLAQALSPSGYGKYGATANSPNFVSAFLLSPDNKNRIRFQPTNPNFTGTITNGVTYKGWNQRMAGNGLLMNTGPGRANDTRVRDTISLNTDSLSVKVIGTNKAPVLDPLLIRSLTPIEKDPLANPGTLVSSLIPGLAVTDPDAGAVKGIAITAADNAQGTWEYTLNGTTWQALGSLSETNARLLPANSTTKIRFVPKLGYEGIPEISFRAWDQSSGVAGGTRNVTINGGLSPFSSESGKAGITVGNVTPPQGNSSPSIPLEILRLLKNPEAPPTPQPVVVGEPPKIADGQDNAQGSGNRAIANSQNGNGTAADHETPGEVIIKQQKPNLVLGTLWGTDKDDVLTASENFNAVYGLQGNDTIFGSASNDDLFGGAGNDILRGGRGRDFIRGGSGDDIIYGGRGQDVIKGGSGNDTIYGGRGADFLSGGTGNDTIYGGRGNDDISGGEGNDRLFGGLGNDTICGCSGDDFLRGGRGNDILNGEKGNDILVGGLGDDILTGGEGKDRFRFAPGSGTDTITDFTIGEDLIELVRGLKFADLKITQGVGGAMIGFQPGSLFANDKPLAILTGVNAASLTPNSFLVV